MRRDIKTCPNCKYEHIDHLTLRPTWWCESPRYRPGISREVGYAPKRRCRIFEPKVVE